MCARTTSRNIWWGDKTQGAGQKPGGSPEGLAPLNHVKQQLEAVVHVKLLVAVK